MAVHTPLSEQTIRDFATPFNLGSLKSFRGLDDGIENTNYIISLTKENATADYILTLFEKLSHADVIFYMELLKLLSKNGLPTPRPISKPDSSQPYQILMDKPALILTKLPGSHPTNPTQEQCHAIGQALARQHAVTINMKHDGKHSLPEMLKAGLALSLPNIDDQHLLNAELANGQELLRRGDLPSGLIHGDLFRDNALFDGNTLTGLLDYYSATTGPLLLDVAIAANDWCVTEDYRTDKKRTDALLSGYQSIRPFTSSEQNSWHDCLHLGALRFWISRLATYLPLQSLSPLPQVPIKNPDEFRQRLLNLRNSLI
jgi:homoserine kinase type II